MGPASPVVRAVELRESFADGNLLGLQRFLARCERLDEDFADHGPPRRRSHVFDLPPPRLKRNADVKHRALRIVLSIQEAGRLNARFQKLPCLESNMLFDGRGWRPD